MSNEFRVSVGEDEKVLEINGGDGCTIVCIHLMLQNCTLEMVKMVNFISCILHHN